MKAGAGGYWNRFDEKIDEKITKQFGAASCVSAVGEMLGKSFGLDISQEKIFKVLGEWSNSAELAKFLNKADASKNWLGGHPQPVLKYTEFLLKTAFLFALYSEKEIREDTQFLSKA